MLATYPMAGPVATGGYRGPGPTAGASGQFSCGAGALSQWRDEGVLGVYEGGTAQTLWAQASGHRARIRGSRGYAPLSPHRCAALGQWARDRDLELSLGRGNLS